MNKLFAKPVVAGAAAWLLTGTLSGSLAHADGFRSPQDLARSQVMRLHVRLTRDALAAPELADARDAATRAYALFYQIRENVLVQVRTRQDYADLKLALWHQQRQLEGLHEELPVSVRKILATATDSLSIRGQINRIENDALAGNETFVAARDDLNEKVGTYQRMIHDALERVRFDPEFLALSGQLRSMGHSFGRPSAGVGK